MVSEIAEIIPKRLVSIPSYGLLKSEKKITEDYILLGFNMF
ncbi:hypothetical protein AEQU2_01789 [Aequorivita lipolytica]|nr:hypothetical protein AEQU2_01789 [Aequorivita lipolytica]